MPVEDLQSYVLNYVALKSESTESTVIKVDFISAWWVLGSFPYAVTLPRYIKK